MVQLQDRVDELYERGKYDRAYLIYRDELALAGDKYAQYMVGFMYLTGKGVEPGARPRAAEIRQDRGGAREELEIDIQPQGIRSKA